MSIFQPNLVAIVGARPGELHEELPGAADETPAVPAWPVTATGLRGWVALAVGAILLAAVVVVLLRVLRGMRPVRR